MNGVGLTLDDLRQPEFNGRVWGYDRAEVDQLLAAVITSIERLQSRRERDAAAVERATEEATEARGRAERAERERDDLAFRLELALQRASVHGQGAGPDSQASPEDGASADDRGGPDDRDEAEADERAVKAAAAALDEAERRVTQAQERAGRAERQVLMLREEMAKQRARARQADVAEAEVHELRKQLARGSERASRAEAAPVALGDPAPAISPAVTADTLAPSESPGAGAVAVDGLFDGLDLTNAAVILPLAQRAARALLREARAAAAAIVAEAEREALAYQRSEASTAPGTSA